MPAAIWAGVTVRNIFNGAETFDWNTDDVKVSLHADTWTPDRDTLDYFDDATGELSTAGGYTAGGQSITTPTIVYDTATDETRLDADDPSWGSASFTARTAVWRKAKGGAASADPVLGYLPFGANVTVSSGTFSIACDSTGHFKTDAT